LLRDNSSRVFDRLKKLRAAGETPVWLVSEDDMVYPTTLAKMIDAGRERIERRTVLLPPAAGGLKDGMLTDNPEPANDVADELFDDKGNRRRVRVWDDEDAPDGMRLIREIVTKPDNDEDADEESTSPRYWRWYELPKAGDSDGSQTSEQPVNWLVHTRDVKQNAERFIKSLPLPDDMKKAIVLAAEFHDLGKCRKLWQRSIGYALPKNPKLEDWLAKSGGKMKLPGFRTEYRHEFGSLLNVLNEDSFKALKDKPEIQDLILHLIAVHHGRGRPHFTVEQAFDPEPPSGVNADALAVEVPQRFARLQRKYGRWGLAYLESLLRAADYAASEEPSEFVEDKS
jgi:CRISPR-associated endonuclease/helicase Cas3